MLVSSFRGNETKAIEEQITQGHVTTMWLSQDFEPLSARLQSLRSQSL